MKNDLKDEEYKKRKTQEGIDDWRSKFYWLTIFIVASVIIASLSHSVYILWIK